MHGFGIDTVFLHFHTVKLVYVIGFAHHRRIFLLQITDKSSCVSDGNILRRQTRQSGISRVFHIGMFSKCRRNMQKCILAQHFCLCIMMYGDGNMQLSGYAISAFGTIVILFFYYERLLQRREVSIKTLFTAFLFAAILLTVQTQLAVRCQHKYFYQHCNHVCIVIFLFWNRYLRLFVSFAFYVVTVLSEGSAVAYWTSFGSLLTRLKSMSLYILLLSVFLVSYIIFYIIWSLPYIIWFI